MPKRFAHGYQVLEDGTEVTYLTSEDYAPKQEGGLPYDDPGLAIAWPLAVTEMSPKDRVWKSWTEVEHTIRTRMALAPAAALGSESGGRG